MADPKPQTVDPRLTPARADLAARHLQGKIEALRYAEGIAQTVVVATASVRADPSSGATQLTQALFGESVTVYEFDDEGWAWGQLDGDGYVGWLPSAALAAPGPSPTHNVSALQSLAFPGPSIKLPPAAHLPLGSRVAVARHEAPFAVMANGWHVPAQHLAALAVTESDFVAVAERFVGTPYLWGGKTAAGLDCSGLVQIALRACGVAALRDSDMQESQLGTSLPSEEWTRLRRGDLIFWSGHVAIARDAATLIHANAHHMSVAIENIADAIARIAAAGSAVTSVKRL